MKTRHVFALSVLAGSLQGLAVFAQTPPPAPASGSGSPVINTAPADKTEPAPLAPEKTKRPRAVSDEVAASIAAGRPKYNPPPKVEPKPEDELVDMRDVDKPKNGIIRLPKHVVTEPKSPVLRDRDVHTKEGLADLAKRRYLSQTYTALNPVTLPLFGTSPEARAMAMYTEDERLNNMADLNENAGLVSAGDKAAGTYIKREAQQTYMRHDDFGWNGGGAK